MPTESFVQVTEGTGKKLHTVTWNVGANTVHDEIVLLGEPTIPTYGVGSAGGLAAAAAARLMTINAGTTLVTRIRRIKVAQVTMAGAAAQYNVSCYRITTAATGGTTVTPSPYVAADGAFSGVARTNAGGAITATLGVSLANHTWACVAAQPGPTAWWEWRATLGVEPILIPAGVANGIVIYQEAGIATQTVSVEIEFTESST